MTKTQNFLEFLKLITKNGKFCINEMAQTLNVSTKTIQRYKKELENSLGIAFQSYQKGCYQVLTLSKIKDILLDPEDMDAATKLAELIVLIENKNLDPIGLDKDVVKAFKNDIYYLKEYPFEELKNPNMKKIKECIKYRKYADIVYEAEERIEIENAKPLKLVFAEGNWYVATMTDDPVNNGFKFLRLNFIKQCKPKPKTFQKESMAEYFIKNFRTLFSSYLQPDFEVRVWVSPEIARHFKVKKFINSQRILKELDDGSLELAYTINNDNEILFLAKRWLPHMKIVEPQYLQKELQKMCLEFLGTT